MKCLEWLKSVYLIQKSSHSSTLPAALIQEAYLWLPPLLFHPISMPFQFFTDAGTWLALRRYTWGGLAFHGKVSGPTLGCEKNYRIKRWIILLACFLHYRNDGISCFMMSGKRRFLVSFFTWDYPSLESHPIISGKKMPSWCFVFLAALDTTSDLS